MIDDLAGLTHKKFMLHYNFPPFSVGEAGRMGGQSRREIGHGFLAERAVKAILPDFEKFPYTIRIVSEVLESNGSSSMGTVLLSFARSSRCGSSDQGQRRRDRHGLDQRGRPRSGFSRTSLVTKITWAIWTLRWRHP